MFWLFGVVAAVVVVDAEVLFGFADVDLAVVEVVVEVVDVDEVEEEDGEEFSSSASSETSVEVASSTRLFPTLADPP